MYATFPMPKRGVGKLDECSPMMPAWPNWAADCPKQFGFDGTPAPATGTGARPEYEDEVEEELARGDSVLVVLGLACGRQETAPVDAETSADVGQRDGWELFEHVRLFEYLSQLPANLVFERGKSDDAICNELIEARREIRECASIHLISSPEERPQVEVHRAGEQDELAQGDGVDDLFVEALQIAICLIRDPEQVGELSRIATARLPRLGQARRLPRGYEILRLEQSHPLTAIQPTRRSGES